MGATGCCAALLGAAPGAVIGGSVGGGSAGGLGGEAGGLGCAEGGLGGETGGLGCGCAAAGNDPLSIATRHAPAQTATTRLRALFLQAPATAWLAAQRFIRGAMAEAIVQQSGEPDTGEQPVTSQMVLGSGTQLGSVVSQVVHACPHDLPAHGS